MEKVLAMRMLSMGFCVITREVMIMKKILKKEKKDIFLFVEKLL